MLDGRKLAGILLVGIVLLMAGLDAVRLRGQWSEMGPLGAGREVPEFVARDLQGARFDRDSLRGQVTMMTFWATWCGACAQQMPTLVELEQSYAPQGLRLVGVNIDRDANQDELAAAYVRQKGLTFPILLDSGRVSDAFRVSLIPHIVLFDARGELRYVHQGKVGRGTLEREIETLLAEQ